jgi:hypothetical protein
MTSGRSTAPSAAVLGSAEPRKREGCDDDEDNNRQNKRQRRDPRQADARSRTERSNRPTPGTNRTFNSRSLRQLQPPSTPHLYQSATQSRPSRSTGNNNKKASCNKFFLRGFSGTDPVNRNAAENVLYKLSHTQCLADILAVAPHEMFSIARDVVDGVYHSISRFEDKEFRRNTPPGRELVGTIGLFVVPVLRGDPKPIDRADNYYLLPGPHDTDILVKIMPGLIINNDHHQHIMFKPLTTKHNTNPEDLRKSGELKRDFVLMRQTPRGNDDSDENDDSHTSEPPCFASLNFVATSDSYDYKSPCYMSITESQTYPRRCPWMDLGYPADVSDYVTLGKILEEASTRLAAPNLAKIAKLARNAPSKLSSNPTQETSPPKFPAKSTGALFQGQEELETLMTKVSLAFHLTGLLGANAI